MYVYLNIYIYLTDLEPQKSRVNARESGFGESSCNTRVLGWKPGFLFCTAAVWRFGLFFPLSHEVAVVGTLSGLLECGKGPRFD